MNDKILSSETPPLQTGHYQHYKGGHYTVVNVARHSESLEWMVVYQCHKDDYRFWVRPYDMFFETVVIDGVEQPRFRYIDQKKDKQA